ncbi:MAG: hypothetical protein HYU46_23305, partial [Deltaproteobacteria bacterium]|nr:hypothetical protein [Deltaproteobacteria bacterium]
MDMKAGLLRAAILLACASLYLSGAAHAADTLPQATAVYGVIATDPAYLWLAQ